MRLDLLGTTAPLLAAWPAHAAAADPGSWAGDTGAVALLGIAAAVAWHHFTAHRREWSERWHGLHVGQRLAHLHAVQSVRRRLHRR